MSTVNCGVCENVVLATSSCPVTGVVAVQVDVANASASVTPGVRPQGVLVSAGEATDGVVVDAYAILIGGANAVSSVSHTLVVAELLESVAKAKSSTIQTIHQLAEATADAHDTVLVAGAAQLLTSAAQAIASIPAYGTTSRILLHSEGVIKSSFASLGLSELASSSASAVGTVAVLQRRVNVDATSSVEATSSLGVSAAPETYLLTSTAVGTSLTQLRTNVSVLVSATATGTAEAWYQDPSAKAWVMNTETTAVGWYDNFDFESIASWQGRELAVGPDGVHELVGDTDNGVPIDAAVESGFTDFGAPQTKRLDNLYFGYTSRGRLAVKTEVRESGHLPSVYLLEQRDASAPRNSRVTPGKGLWGRYWRLTLTNVDGTDFEVDDATVDIAVSTRRL
jgi:hypothetical protein